jgi:hypothetical protein
MPASPLPCRLAIIFDLESELQEWQGTVILGRLKRLKGSRFGSPSVQEDKTISDFFSLCDPVSSARLNPPDFRLLYLCIALIMPYRLMSITYLYNEDNND